MHKRGDPAARVLIILVVYKSVKLSRMSDALFSVKNALYLGAAQSAIGEAAHLTGLSEEERQLREVLTFRAYIEIGSYDVRMGIF